MVVTITNAECVRRLKMLKTIGELDTVLPAVVGYKIIKTIRNLEEVLGPYDIMRQKTIKKYAKDGQSVLRDEDPDAFDACVKELSGLDALETSVEIEKFPVSMIDDKDLPIKAVFALDFMLE